MDKKKRIATFPARQPQEQRDGGSMVCLGGTVRRKVSREIEEDVLESNAEQDQIKILRPGLGRTYFT